MGVDGSKYGPYVISEVGPHRMYFSPDHKWDINTSNERNAYWCLETNTYYFSNNKWWDNVYYYVWDNTGKTEKSWPGNVATFVERNDYGEDIYKIEISSSYIGLVFNNKADKQTKDIDISLYASGTGFYLTGDNSPYDVVSYQYK